MHQELAKRGVEMLAVDFGDKAETIVAYFKKERFEMTPLQQEGDEVSRAFGVQTYPTNYLLDASGKVAWRMVGFDEAAFRAVLDKVAPER